MKTFLAGSGDSQGYLFHPTDQMTAKRHFIGQSGLLSRASDDFKTGTVGAAIKHAGVAEAFVDLPTAFGPNIFQGSFKFVFPADEDAGGEKTSE